MEIQNRLRSLQLRLDTLAGGRRVELLGVTKGQDPQAVREAVAAGLTILGNNYVQPGAALRRSLENAAAVKWHFIGSIQSRKVRELLDYDCIQSLDRLSIAEDLDRRLGAIGKKTRVLVQVNIGDESTKSGVAVDDVPNFLKSLRALSSLEPIGLMALPPALEPVDTRRPYFAQMKSLFDSCSKAQPLSCLSMGTSDDYAIAIEEGATLVRLGTALFGARRV